LQSVQQGRENVLVQGAKVIARLVLTQTTLILTISFSRFPLRPIRKAL
jgi:hypothetical protein